MTERDGEEHFLLIGVVQPGHLSVKQVSEMYSEKDREKLSRHNYYAELPKTGWGAYICPNKKGIDFFVGVGKKGKKYRLFVDEIDAGPDHSDHEEAIHRKWHS